MNFCGESKRCRNILDLSLFRISFGDADTVFAPSSILKQELFYSENIVTTFLGGMSSHQIVVAA
jgi:hypothetical protein